MKICHLFLLLLLVPIFNVAHAEPAASPSALTLKLVPSTQGDPDAPPANALPQIETSIQYATTANEVLKAEAWLQAKVADLNAQAVPLVTVVGSEAGEGLADDKINLNPQLLNPVNQVLPAELLAGLKSLNPKWFKGPRRSRLCLTLNIFAVEGSVYFGLIFITRDIPIWHTFMASTIMAGMSAIPFYLNPLVRKLYSHSLVSRFLPPLAERSWRCRISSCLIEQVPAILKWAASDAFIVATGMFLFSQMGIQSPEDANAATWSSWALAASYVGHNFLEGAWELWGAAREKHISEGISSLKLKTEDIKYLQAAVENRADRMMIPVYAMGAAVAGAQLLHLEIPNLAVWGIALAGYSAYVWEFMRAPVKLTCAGPLIQDGLFGSIKNYLKTRLQFFAPNALQMSK